MALARLGAGQLVFHDSDSRMIRHELTTRVGLVAVVADKVEGTVDEVPRVEPPPGDRDELIRRGGAPFEPVRDGSLVFLHQRTSGTTGIPKIAPLSHRAGAFRLLPQPIDFPGMRVGSLIPISFDAAKHNLVRSLLMGECIVLAEKLKPEEAGEFVARHGINFLNGTPINADQLLKAAPSKGLLFPSLKVFRLGTAAMTAPLREAIIGRVTPNIYVFYGMTEIGSVSLASPQDTAETPNCVGRPVPGVEIEIRDETGALVSDGEVGHVRVKSPGMIDGYLNADEENAEAFRDGWYHSGDLCAMNPDGMLIHHGRADEMMIFDGINIHPSEIEAVLLRHPAIAETSVFGYESGAHGDVPIAAVVLKHEVSKKELAAHCKKWLGSRTVRGLIAVPALPRTSTGKVVKRELVEIWRREIAKQNPRAASGKMVD
jgi:acyl-coenzyme A synthetase/AMP-(fatty) acid ligase